MAELGQTQDPAELVVGTPEAIEENVRVLRTRADQAGRASEGLKAIDTGAWQGPAARTFHEKFSYEPGKWYKAADALLTTADALQHYATTLRWAQGQATEAIASWAQAETATRQAQAKHDQDVTQAAASGQPVPTFNDPGAAARQAAWDTLSRARGQLNEVGTWSPVPSRTRPKERPRARAGSMTSETSSPTPAATCSTAPRLSSTPSSTIQVMRL
ncbi:putative T7SS-secreted protein [Amycolatopsis sp. PS_44_ISF1]|uniref:putative T7SS-secreted protein n=1 Tax=Amycolatopsis sp. PS_44_ISF1 TaxID=2974917 RepID=UPI0028DDEFB9|nr:hypothetical protein [Amycolatopsis sp. PS_44_ISF1]MDT8911267.1 hypothetical protein [Amycolatopsis sp. PS_44_ISF1]